QLITDIGRGEQPGQQLRRQNKLWPGWTPHVMRGKSGDDTGERATKHRIRSAVARLERSEIREARAKGKAAPHSAAIHAGYRSTRFTCQIARSQRCAAGCKRVPGHPWSSFPFPPKGMGAPRPAGKCNNLSALATRPRIPKDTARLSALHAALLTPRS